MLASLKSYLIGAACLIVCAAVVSSYFYGTHVGTVEAEAKQAKLDATVIAVRDAAQEGAAAAIAKIDIKQTTIRQTVEHTIRENVVYRDCVNDPTVERLLNDARADRAPAEPAGSGVLPGTSTNPTP